MRSTITRTMTTTKVTFVTTDVKDGKPVLSSEQVKSYPDLLDTAKAEKLLKKEDSTKTYTVLSAETEEHTYEISVVDFIKYAKRVEDTPTK
jgi:hypothetical protein